MKSCLKAFMVCVVFVFEMAFHGIDPNSLWAVDISDIPLESTIHSPAPALVFILDNSASMDCEFMTPEANGLFNGHYYLFPDASYEPANDHIYGAGCALDNSERRMWQSQWSQYNLMYYSPRETYLPWPSTPEYVFKPSHLHRPLSRPALSEMDAARLQMASEFFSVETQWGTCSISNAHYFTHLDANDDGSQDGSAKDIYLVTWNDDNGDGRLDVGDDMAGDCRRYYRLADDGDNCLEAGELVPVSDSVVRDKLRPMIVNPHDGSRRHATDKEELQNFVNWFTYYRRRSSVAKALVAQYIMQTTDVRIGLYALNNSPRIPVRDILSIEGASAFEEKTTAAAWELLNRLYAMQCAGGTPLRYSLDQVGRYYHQALVSDLGPSPFLDIHSGGSCQRAATVLVTDGFRNGERTATGNADGDSGAPFADPWGDTLADIAMQYYQEDLGPDLPDSVAPTVCDTAPHQHMTTHIVSLGGLGTMDSQFSGDFDCMASDSRDADLCAHLDQGASAEWPQPVSGPTSELPPVPESPQIAVADTIGDSRIDDLRHAAVNGRGGFLSGQRAEALSLALRDAFNNFEFSGAAAAVAVSGAYLSAGSMIFQTRYDTTDWNGDLLAFSCDAGTGNGDFPENRALWHASSALKPSDDIWDSRRIVTYGGNWRRPQGIPFRYQHLSANQTAALGSGVMNASFGDVVAHDMLEFLRGREIEGYRKRKNLLGDIVHAAPILFGQTLFVGANEGMLHAFDAQTGKERFAYIPHLVFGHLNALGMPEYVDRHRFYIDGACYAGEVLVDEYVRHTYLVGGLGKGGKGYFCLLVGKRERTGGGDGPGDYRWTFHVDTMGEGASEAAVSAMVQWEYPRPEPADDDMDNDGDGLVDEMDERDADLGYSFSAGYPVNANTVVNSYRPVVIFGNGYNSESGKAVLYVLDAHNGTLIRKIDTGAALDNGLSTPALIDVNLDRKVDYAYAGDLKGNIWKFDLTAETPERWGVAYGTDADRNGVIDAGFGDAPAPLFQAMGQPITGRPDVMAMSSMCATQAPGYMVIFGTGRYLGLSDLSNDHRQSIFGIWDYGDDCDDSEVPGILVDRDSGWLSSGLRLKKQVVAGEKTVGGSTYRELSANAIEYGMVEDSSDDDGFSGNNHGIDQKGNPDVYVGWFLDFPVPPGNERASAERVTGNVVIRGGHAVIVSHTPSGEPCGHGGESWLYVLNGCDGSMLSAMEGEFVQPKRFRGRLNNNPIVIKDATQGLLDYLLIGDHKGNIHKIGFRGESLGKVYWRHDD